MIRQVKTQRERQIQQALLTRWVPQILQAQQMGPQASRYRWVLQKKQRGLRGSQLVHWS
jgi:hypothetical protein